MQKFHEFASIPVRDIVVAKCPLNGLSGVHLGLSFDVTQISLLQKDKKYDVIIKRTGYTSGPASLKLQQQLVPQIHFMTNPMQFCFLVASLSKNRDRNGLEPLLN